MRYTVRLERTTEKQLERLPAETLRRLSQKLLELEQNPRVGNVRKLRGMEGYRLRVGDYRILFTIDDVAKEVRVYRVKHRKEAYREI